MNSRRLYIRGVSIAQRLAHHTRVLKNGCHRWIGCLTDGYGSIYINGKKRPAHRVSYEVHVGPIPEGMEPDHTCRHRWCINPAHIEPVTHIVNVRRGTSPTARNAARTHCAHGHPFTPGNTYRRPEGGRTCRTCRRGWALDWYRRQRRSA